jgi:apolipoprotein N-acyltransferase
VFLNPYPDYSRESGPDGPDRLNAPNPPISPWLRLAGIVASAALLGLYARGGHAWILGFVALVPWLLALDAERSVRGALVSGLAMCLAFVALVFTWFGAAIGSYTGIGAVTGTLALFVLAPLLQPQILAFVLVRHFLGQRHGLLLRVLGGASAWVACEWLVGKLFGDTLGHGLLPSASLRQLADLGGAAAITFLLILVNEAIALAIRRRRHGVRALAAPLAVAIALPIAMSGYGLARLHHLTATLAEPAPTLRIGMVQANITDYERLRETHGAYAVVRHVLDTHYGLSQAAVEHHEVDALLWSETVYPTTFGHPRSEDGAALDREILDFVDALGVPLVFGTYDLDAAGEYNAAAFIEPGSGLLGYYRKTHPFPLTEHVPAWLDRPLLRRLLPWTGSWQPGAGARVFPLRTADGREVDVLPLICLDDVRSQLAIDGARLGAQAILGLSNDSWFSDYPSGARLHLTVAAFRSIETRLPQIRVTTNGLSAIIDETGEVLVQTRMGDQAVLAGEIPARDPPPTLIVRWGDWFGRAALLFLLALAAVAGWRELGARLVAADARARSADRPAVFAADIVALTTPWRIATAVLRLCAGAGLLWLALRMLLRDGLQVGSLAQIWLFAAAVVAPAIAAWAIQRAFAGSARIDAGRLVLELRSQRVELPLAQITGLHAWRLPLPRSGVDLQLGTGERWSQGIALPDPTALLRALQANGSPATITPASARSAALAEVRAASPARWFDHALVRFALLPLLLALPAFRLHQHIAFGGTFGEYYTYGLAAWLSGLLIWWAAWAIGVMLVAATLRVAIETATVLTLQLAPSHAVSSRRMLEWLGRLILFLGIPGWLLLRIVGS